MSLARLALLLVVVGAGISGEAAWPPVPRFTSSLGLEFVLVPGGTYQMGYDDAEYGTKPVHQVTVSPFYVARQAVTKRLFRLFARSTGASVNQDELGPELAEGEALGADRWRNSPPAYGMAPTEDCQVRIQSMDAYHAFAKWFSRYDGRDYRVVSEAQFEWLARSGIAFGREDHWWQVDQPSARANWTSDGEFNNAGISLDGDLAIPGLYPQTPWGIYLYPIAHAMADGWYQYGSEPEVDPVHPRPLLMNRNRALLRANRIWFRTWHENFASAFLLLVTDVCQQDRRPPDPPRPLPPPPAQVVRDLPTQRLDVGGGETIVLRQVPATRGVIGRSREERPWSKEWPETPVSLQAYWLGETEVTQGQFRRVLQFNPGRPQGDDLPVNLVRMSEMVAFCDAVALRERAAGRLDVGETYRLPTEAEWEIAAMAGSRTRFSFGDDPALLGHFAWYDGVEGVQAVKTKRPNSWGFYDMQGNVLEVIGEGAMGYIGREQTTNWHSLYDEKMNSIPRPRDAMNTGMMANWFAARGGAWNMGAIACEPTIRREVNIAFSGTEFIGFRLARGPIPGRGSEWSAIVRDERKSKRYQQVMTQAGFTPVPSK